MKRLNAMKTQMKPVTAAVALALLAGPAAATEFWLCVKPTTLTMPDGALVPMWGYVEDDDSNLSNGCLNDAQIPGPTLEVTAGDLTIHLRNDLPAGNPTSIVIPGQPLPDGSTPTWDDGSTGARCAADPCTPAEQAKRVRSFGTEVAPGATGDYVWDILGGNGLSGNGTLLYHSGTHPQKQVYMGLGGLVSNDSGAGEVHPGVTYANSVELFFSDIDPAFNDAVAGGTLTTAINRRPSWFLINGEPYEAGVTPDITVGTAGPLARGEETLLRLASTATDTHVAVLQGLNMTIHAEDGFQYNYQEGGTITPAPRVQYSAMLPPAKTKDVIVVVPSQNPETLDSERYAVYDGNGYLTNPSDPAASQYGDTVGGMLRFLSFAPSGNTPPVADAQSLSTDEDVPLPITLTGSDGDSDPLTFSVATGPANGTLSGTEPSLTYTPNADYNGPDSFTFVANDGTVDSAAATVDITVNPMNDAPVVDAQAVSTGNLTPVAIILTGSDVDVGDTLTFAVATGPANGVLSGTEPNLTYTPNGGYVGPDSFTFVANDGTVDSVAATVDITVTEPNAAPVADPQIVVTNEDTPVDITLTGSDVDVGDVLTFAVAMGPANGVLSGTEPSLTYTPNVNYFGPDSFTYVANDGTVDSAAATVDITVNPVNDAPVADAQAIPTDQDTPVGITLTGSDVDVGDVLTFAVATGPANGVLSGTEPSLIYTPNAGYFGPDSFTYVANDGTVDSPEATVDITVSEVVTVTTTLYFSTVGAGSVPGVGGPYDDADVYTLDSTSAFARLYDATSGWPAGLDLPNNANIDGLSINGTTIYVSFAGSNTNVPGIGGVPDEDVVAYDTTADTWSTYFDGSICGLDGSNGQDVDAISVSGGTLYFSTQSGGDRNPVGGVAAPYDDADVYTWVEGAGTCGRALQASTAGLPDSANVDGLTVAGTSYYMSFTDATNVPLVGVVQDESVVVYDSGISWSPAAYFSGTGQLDGTDSQDVDAFQVP